MPAQNNRQEAANLGPERLDLERNRWQMLKMSVEAMREHPLLPELERIGSQAGSLWQRNAMLMNMPESGEQITQNWQRMGELYDRAMELRARMLGTRISAELGGDPRGGDVRDFAMERLGETFSLDGESNNSAMRTVNRTLSTYMRGLTADPEAVLSGNGSASDGYFYRRNRRTGRLNVNWRRIDDAYRNIDMISGSPIAAVNPQQRQLLQQMRAGIRQVESVDPVGAALADWRRSAPVSQGDYRPIRFLTGVGASLITGMGLYMGSKQGFTWPTALWAGVAALSFNPDLARSGTYNAVKRLSYLNTPQAQNMIQHGHLSGDRGAAVIEELQELRRERGAEFRALTTSPGGVTMAQIGELTEGRNTPLVQAMAGMRSDGERAAFVRMFTQPRSRDEQQIVREYIRGLDRIDPRLEQSRMLFGDQQAAA